VSTTSSAATTSSNCSRGHRGWSGSSPSLLRVSRSPPPTTADTTTATSPRERGRRFFLRKPQSQPRLGGAHHNNNNNINNKERLGHLLSSSGSSKRRSSSLEPQHSMSGGGGLSGRAAAVFSALPPRLHKYASVLNDMFLPDVRDPDLRDDKRVLEKATVMMRRARLVQLVVLVILAAAKRANLCILLDSLEQMDDASWDVLYKLTQWQKKAQKLLVATTTTTTTSSRNVVAKHPPGRTLRRLVGRVLHAATGRSVRRSFGNDDKDVASLPSSSQQQQQQAEQAVVSSPRAAAANAAERKKSSSFSLSRQRRGTVKYDGVEVAPFATELAAQPPKCVVFVVAPLSSNLGSQRAEWLETKRLAESYGAFVEVRPFTLEEAFAFAAERLKLCSPDSPEKDRRKAVALVAAAGPLRDLVAATHTHVDVLAQMLADARAQGRVVATAAPLELRVSPSLAFLEPPLAHWLATLSAVDALPARTQYVLAAAAVFRKFTPTLLKKVALVHNDLGFVQAMCLELCKPVEPTGRRLLQEDAAPSSDDAALFAAIAVDRSRGGPRTGDDDPAGPPSSLPPRNTDDGDLDRSSHRRRRVLKEDKVYTFAEPMTHRALAGTLLESQILFALENVADLPGLALDERDHLYDLICPYVRRKYARRRTTFDDGRSSHDDDDSGDVFSSRRRRLGRGRTPPSERAREPRRRRATQH